MKKTIKIIIGLIITVGIVCAIILATMNNKVKMNPPGTLGNTPGNLMNGGRFAEVNGYVFFANPTDHDKLYRMKIDGTEITKLNDDIVADINVCDNYIFYVRNNNTYETSGSIFRGQLYGVVRSPYSGKDTFALSTDVTKHLLLVDNTVVYASYKKPVIYTMHVGIDKSDEGTYTNVEIPMYSYYQGKLYYSGSTNDHNIYAFNLASNYSELVLEGNTYLACMVDGDLYYIDLTDGYCLTKHNMTTGEDIKLAHHVINYNVYGNQIFYQIENGSEHGLYRMNTAGYGETFIMEGNISSISCTSNYTYITKFNGTQIWRTTTGSAGPVEVMIPTDPKAK